MTDELKEEQRLREIHGRAVTAVDAAKALAHGTGRTHVVMVSTGVVRIVDVERSRDTEFVGVFGVAPAASNWPTIWGLVFAFLAGFLVAAWFGVR